MHKIFDGYEFYFMPKKQTHTQVHILMKRIEEQGVITDLQRDTTTHIVISKGSM
jgi:hypothetical protein